MKSNNYGEIYIDLKKRIRSLLRKLDPITRVRNFIHSPRLFGGRYTVEDNTEVIIYTNRHDLFTSYSPQRSLEEVVDNRVLEISFIATAFNEVTTVDLLLSGIFNQTRLPDEIILVDTGSTDGTIEKLEQFAETSSIPFEILVHPGGNIAQGRNLAISKARYPIIAVSDFGCDIPNDWLENLIIPFEDDPKIQVAFGTYHAIDANRNPSSWILGWRLDQINPKSHLPSAVSIAFRKEVWEKVGGYPEWLTMTGEDTYFALELKRSTTQWAFVPEALVQWIAPQTFSETLQKSYRWSTGDGEAGTNASSYRWALIKLSALVGAILAFLTLITVLAVADYSLLRIIAGILMLAGFITILVGFRKRQSTIKDEIMLAAVYSAELLGFIIGLSRRPRVDQQRMANTSGAIFILSGVPIDDTGGGARWTQLALEFLRRQYIVFFVNKFPKYESKDLYLEFKHPNLVTKEIRDLNWSTILEKYKPSLVGKPVIGLVELPLKDYLLTIEDIQSLNSVVAYDLIDAWETSLGGDWYSSEIEQRIIEASDLHFATVAGLAENLGSRTHKPVHLVPNAVNNYLFNPDQSYSRPEDYPADGWNIIYIGALWGDWFDWDLLGKISKQYPDANLIVIGDTMGRETEMLGNVHFLGLKPQQDLPAYLHYSDVGIVPWKVNFITQMTSPLKVYEYIAMYKPVVVPMLDPLKGIPGVFQVEDEFNFVEMVGELKDWHPPEKEMAKFINQNNWQARVDQILGLVNQIRDA